MRSFLRDNGLTVVLGLLFFLSLSGMIATGLASYNDELVRHHQPILSLGNYLLSGQFLSALFENWESEFLQMGVYVVLTAWLFQRGSAESKDPDEPDEDEKQPAWKMPSFLYSHSLGLVLFTLFLLSFLLHWIGSVRASTQEALMHGERTTDYCPYFLNSELWFESFQNWQSEFLSTAVLVVLSIFLREKGSPESKPVRASNRQTGD
ncbi:hypothetical protein F9K85_21930 [Brucella tritici]|uniref:DUF6766 family protein n=1 Tax=Brucella tritici TaxID=94626 RepID=UPI00124EDACF|nr:DUF6766 family protein [Brucella tritici]KAB2671371.1 hypothetical protein F9K85_21930 [Brucella tritici]